MTKRAWAVCTRNNKPLLHTIKATKREILDYCHDWCAGRERWKRIARDAGYQVKRITITVD